MASLSWRENGTAKSGELSGVVARNFASWRVVCGNYVAEGKYHGGEKSGGEE